MLKIIKDLYNGHRPTIHEFVDELKSVFPLLERFEETPQDAIWHAEGNVLIHTGMVLDETYKLIDENDLSKDDQVILILSALLHDISKPTTTYAEHVERENRVCVKATKHEIIGRDYLTYKLLNLGINEYVYKKVISLVAYHNIPKMLVIRNNGKSEYIKHLQMVDYKLMYLLEVADIKGRICHDTEQQLQYLEEYKMFCEEYSQEITDSYNDVVGTYLMSINEMYSLDEAEHKLWNYKEHSHVTVLCGIPASGKSSNAKGKIISLDEIRKEIGDTNYKKSAEVLLIAKERLKECLRNKEDVTYDATNYRKDFRKKIFDLCHAYHARVTVHLVLKPVSACLRDNKDRPNPVDDDYIMHQAARFEYPEYGEYHDMKLTIRY